ncbi:MAG: hypothetical protein Q9213_002405 [Squamulea squamosa]
MAKLKKWVAKLKLSKKTESKTNDGLAVGTTASGGKAEPAEPESPIARPADHLRNPLERNGTHAFLSTSDVKVPPKQTRRIIQPHERYIERLIDEHNGSAQSALSWATQQDKRNVVKLLLDKGIHDATPNRFRRCLNFVIRRDDSELLIKFLDTARDKEDLLPAILADVAFLKLLVKDANPVVTESYLDCLSEQSRREIIRAAIDREDMAFLARVLPMVKDNDYRKSILHNVDFLILAEYQLAGATEDFQLLMRGLSEEDREALRSQFRKGVPTGIAGLTLSADLDPHSHESPEAKPDNSLGLDTEGTKKQGLWPDRVETDPKTKEKVKVSPMEPYYWN